MSSPGPAPSPSQDPTVAQDDTDANNWTIVDEDETRYRIESPDKDGRGGLVRLKWVEKDAVHGQLIDAWERGKQDDDPEDDAARGKPGGGAERRKSARLRQKRVQRRKTDPGPPTATGSAKPGRRSAPSPDPSDSEDDRRADTHRSSSVQPIEVIFANAFVKFGSSAAPVLPGDTPEEVRRIIDKHRNETQHITAARPSADPRRDRPHADSAPASSPPTVSPPRQPSSRVTGSQTLHPSTSSQSRRQNGQSSTTASLVSGRQKRLRTLPAPEGAEVRDDSQRPPKRQRRPAGHLEISSPPIEPPRDINDADRMDQNQDGGEDERFFQTEATNSDKDDMSIHDDNESHASAASSIYVKSPRSPAPPDSSTLSFSPLADGADESAPGSQPAAASQDRALPHPGDDPDSDAERVYIPFSTPAMRLDPPAEQALSSSVGSDGATATVDARR